MAEPRNEGGAADGKLDIRAADVVDVLTRRNPKASNEQVAFAAQLMARTGEIAQRPEMRSRSGEAVPSKLLAALELLELALALLEITPIRGDASDRVQPPLDAEPRLVLAPRGPVEVLQGTGLGERISLAEGQRQLAAYTTPLAMEEWAGPLAGPMELSERFGIARSTLQDWRRSDAVIGLLKGKRKHVFPLAQFVDGRPVEGLALVVAIVGDPRRAWLWLVEPDRDGGSHLSDLKRGRIEAVLEAAREDFA